MLTQPFFSVIIPSYNHEKYISQAILSVISQSYKNLELIVIDDGSVDNSLMIINALAEKHDFTVISRENRGLAKTLNQGIGIAKGKYISFLASDDYYLPNRVLNAVRVFENSSNEVAAVCCDGYVVNAAGDVAEKFSSKNVKPPFGSTYDNLIILNWLPAMGITYRLNDIKKFMFDEKFRYEDYTLYLRMFHNDRSKIINYKEFDFNYRWHGGNTSGNSQVSSEEINLIRIVYSDVGNFHDFKQIIIGQKSFDYKYITLRNLYLLLLDSIWKFKRFLYNMYFTMLGK